MKSKFVIVEWPEIQSYIDKEGFNNNCCLINDATSMDKYTYLKDIEKVPIQHLENKRIKGFYCNWNEYTFWISENDFNKICIIEKYDKEI